MPDEFETLPFPESPWGPPWIPFGLDDAEVGAPDDR